MKADALDLPAIAVFIAFFALVTVLGFIASRWKAGDLLHLHEWGLGGRRFGVAVSWFLFGLYRDCGAGASVLGGRLWLFCAALYDHRLSLHLSCDAETVDRLPSRRACDGG